MCMMAGRSINIGMIYKDIYGNKYVVEDLIHNIGSTEVYVLCRLIGCKEILVCNIREFAAEVDHEKHPSVTQKYMYELCTMIQINTDFTGHSNHHYDEEDLDRIKNGYCPLETMSDRKCICDDFLNREDIAVHGCCICEGMLYAKVPQTEAHALQMRFGHKRVIPNKIVE